ncbi:MAG: hypothetical protein JST90_16310 [Bacteroidetes bacterium]|nr:hypothetical protein [Bacteroidota bacterium]
MTRYQNLGGNSGVTAYEAGADYIALQFHDGRVYVYDHTRPGRKHVEQMKQLAQSGRGLTTYLNQYVRDNYAHMR